LDDGNSVEHAVPNDRYIYVHVARGGVSLNGAFLQAGDGVKIIDENLLILDQGQKAEVLVFELW
jgi:hypothetical protein